MRTSAISLDPISDPEGSQRSLRDYLMDVLEPPPLPDEVSVGIVKDQTDQAVLRARVQPTEGREPYALLKSGGRHFLIRSGDRLRPMTREEVLGSPARSRNAADLAAATTELRKVRAPD
jgi:hypothetical protein